jgi:hypothetical protein
MARAKGNGESVAGYFRNIFAQNRNLLWERSNDQLFKQWLDDHPGHTEVPPKVKQNLQNIKSVLRKEDRKRRKGGRPKKSAAAPTGAVAGAAPANQVAETVTGAPLEGLEIAIDDCMVLARGIDAERLHDVIAHLRRARNAVVWMQGQ